MKLLIYFLLELLKNTILLRTWIYGETSVYREDLKSAEGIVQIHTAIDNYLNWHKS